MDELQRIVEGFEVFGTSKDFRLWLTTASTSDFPVTVLQASVKLTSDPPVGLKANMKNVYHQLDDNSLGATSKPVLFRKLMFGESTPQDCLVAHREPHVCICRAHHVPFGDSRASALRSPRLEHSIRVQRQVCL